MVMSNTTEYLLSIDTLLEAHDESISIQVLAANGTEESLPAMMQGGTKQISYQF